MSGKIDGNNDGWSMKGVGSMMVTKEAAAALHKSHLMRELTGAQSDTTYYKQPLQSAHGENVRMAPLECRAIVFEDGSMKVEQNGFGDIDPNYKMLAEWSQDEPSVEDMKSEVSAQAEELTKDKDKPEIGL